MDTGNWQYYVLANEHHFELAREEKNQMHPGRSQHYQWLMGGLST